MHYAEFAEDEVRLYFLKHFCKKAYWKFIQLTSRRAKPSWTLLKNTRRISGRRSGRKLASLQRYGVTSTLKFSLLIQCDAGREDELRRENELTLDHRLASNMPRSILGTISPNCWTCTHTPLSALRSWGLRGCDGGSRTTTTDSVSLTSTLSCCSHPHISMVSSNNLSYNLPRTSQPILQLAAFINYLVPWHQSGAHSHSWSLSPSLFDFLDLVSASALPIDCITAWRRKFPKGT